MEEFDLPKIAQEAYELVYEPREDSFLFLDALEEERAYLLDLKPSLCLEMGPGSGVVSTFLSALLADLPLLFLGADINPNAARVTAEVSTLLSPCYFSYPLVRPLATTRRLCDPIRFSVWCLISRQPLEPVWTTRWTFSSSTHPTCPLKVTTLLCLILFVFSDLLLLHMNLQMTKRDMTIYELLGLEERMGWR